MPLKKFSFPADLISGSGRYQSWMVLLTMPSANVQQMLPAELELAPQAITPAGTHPLLLMFGHQLDVEIHLGPAEMFDMDYLEFVLDTPTGA